MKAAVLTRYGPPEVVQIRELPMPVPRDDELLIRVRAAAVTAGDCEIRSFRIHWLIWLPMRFALAIRRRGGPIVLGTDFSGIVEAAGNQVTKFGAGDRVFGTAGFTQGSWAEYACIREGGGEGALARMPDEISFEEAASSPLGGMMAAEFLRKASIRPGSRVLIIGAGGSIGVFAVQAAKREGAHVTAVDSAGKLEMLRTAGADEVFDYARDDYGNSGKKWDVIYSVAGNQSYSFFTRVLNDGGVYLLANLRPWHHLRGLFTALVSDRKVKLIMQRESNEEMQRLALRIGEGELRPVVDKAFPIEQVAEALRYQDSGQKRGSIVLVMR